MMAHVLDLRYLADSTHINTTLNSIMKYNYHSSFEDHFNNMRSYALGNEAGVVVTVYPDPSKRPAIPLSYGFEVWTGLEYTAATGMLYQGMNKEGLQIISDTRNRYDGFKRNPFNEEECGNHYTRAMASWSAIPAISRFNYSGVDRTFSITAKPGNYFWSNGYSWGKVNVSGKKVTVAVHHGRLDVREVRLSNSRSVKLQAMTTVEENRSAVFTVQ